MRVLFYQDVTSVTLSCNLLQATEALKKRYGVDPLSGTPEDFVVAVAEKMFFGKPSRTHPASQVPLMRLQLLSALQRVPKNAAMLSPRGMCCCSGAGCMASLL
jgi:hypothetical protein